MEVGDGDKKMMRWFINAEGVKFEAEENSGPMKRISEADREYLNSLNATTVEEVFTSREEVCHLHQTN
jgi:hypothetical protein